MAILSNMRGRDIHLVSKKKAHFHDGLGSPDHCSKPPDIEITGHFSAKFVEEKFSVLNTNILYFREQAPQKLRECSNSNLVNASYSCR